MPTTVTGKAASMISSLAPTVCLNDAVVALTAMGVSGISPEFTVPVMSRGLKTAQFRPDLVGASDVLPTIVIVNCWPESFSVSSQLTGEEANTPAAVKAIFVFVSGLAASSLGAATRQHIAAAATLTNSIFRTFHENIAISLSCSILAV